MEIRYKNIYIKAQEFLIYSRLYIKYKRGTRSCINDAFSVHTIILFYVQTAINKETHVFSVTSRPCLKCILLSVFKKAHCDAIQLQPVWLSGSH